MEKQRVINLGDKIMISRYYKRRTVWKQISEMSFKQRHKVWEVTPLKKEELGIIIGVRTLSNGRTDYDSVAGYMYSPKEFFKALLVSTSLHRAPILVPV